MEPKHTTIFIKIDWKLGDGELVIYASYHVCVKLRTIIIGLGEKIVTRACFICWILK